MRVAAVSDLHHRVWDADVPDGIDLLLVAGDFGHTDELEAWLPTIGLPPERIVACAGNHDWVAIKKPHAVRQLPWTYLEDQQHVVDGLLIYGTPWTPPFMDWAFMVPEDALARKYAEIPEKVDILVSHGPSRGCGDMPRNTYGQEDGAGSTALRARCDELRQLKLHVYGHIHEGRGQRGIYRFGGQWTNVSLLDEYYEPWPRPMEVFNV